MLCDDGGHELNYTAYVTNVKERLGAQSFTELPLPGDTAAALALVMQREEPQGRRVIALAGKLNLPAAGEGEAVAAAAGALVRALAAQEACHLILVFPYDRKVTEAESGALLALRQADGAGRWSLIPWVADLEVELLDRHTGAPKVDDRVARALTEVPRGTVEALWRRSTGPKIGRSPLDLNLGHLPASRLILAITIAAYLWVLIQGGGVQNLVAGPNSRTLMVWGANVGPLVLVAGQQWRLFTHMLLHGGLWHLGLNMWAFWNLGRHVEMVYGPLRMLFIYVVAGVTGGLASVFFRTGYAVSVGASGAILGLMGALVYFALTLRGRSVDWRALLGPVAINLFYGFLFPFIDNQAHIGGFIGGFAAAFIAGVPGQRTLWRQIAMGVTALVLFLVLAGVIPL